MAVRGTPERLQQRQFSCLTPITSGFRSAIKLPRCSEDVQQHAASQHHEHAVETSLWVCRETQPLVGTIVSLRARVDARVLHAQRDRRPDAVVAVELLLSLIKLEISSSLLLSKRYDDQGDFLSWTSEVVGVSL